ncbi:MAG: holin family protein [Bacillota bacterium]
MSLDPISAVLDIGSKVIDRLWPDPAQAAQAKLELFKLQQSGELAQITGQLEINKTEAANASVFVSGWRPAIGWICGAALAYQYIIRPVVSWGAIAAGHPLPPMPGLDENLWQLLLGMLGLGGLRTFEKINNVAAK